MRGFDGKVVDEVTTLGIIFGGVDVGVGGAVDDAVDGVVVHEAKNGFAVGDVEGQRERIGLCGDISEVKAVRRGGGEATNFAAELTARAGDENLHGGMGFNRVDRRCGSRRGLRQRGDGADLFR